MKKRFIKSLSVMLSMVIVTVATAQEAEGAEGILKNAVIGNAYKVDLDTHGVREDYIVLTDNEKAYNGLKKNTERKEIQTDLYLQEPLLEDENLLVMNLTAEEAGQIEDMNGVVNVEKDFQVMANDVVPVNEAAVDHAVEEKQDLALDQWNLRAIDCVSSEAASGSAVEYEEKGKSDHVKVALLDSGVNFREGISVCERVDLVSENSISPCFEDATGHGTGIAGMITGNKDIGDLSGVVQDISLYSVRVLDENNSASVSRIVEGIYWCIDNGMDVINLSLGCKYHSEVLAVAVQDAIDAGLILVAAAGNDGTETDQMNYPAAYEGVIAVGSSDENNQVSDFTSCKDQIDVMAPGEKIWTYSVLGGYMAVDGTSIATAQVTGSVARVLQIRKHADYEYMQRLVTACSVRDNPAQRAGVLNVQNMLEAAQSNQEVEGTIIPREIREDVHYDADEIVTGCWGKTTHKGIVQVQYSGEYVGVVATGAYNADALYKDRKMLHAQHNYVRNLHFLYMAARRLRSSSKDFTTKTKLENFLNDISTTNLKDAQFGASDVQELRIIIANYIVDQEGLDKGNALKAAMVIGLATHLVGDTYAHRTMIPRDDTQIGSDKFSQTLWETYHWKRIHFVIESRDLKKFELDTNQYEDNVSFYPQRYTATQSSVGNLMSLYSNNREFSPYSIYINGVSFGMKLNNLSAYAASNGYSNAGLDGISTTDYRVNSNHQEPEKSVFPNETDFKDYEYFIC